MQRLEQQYRFSCSCARCTDEGKLDGAFQSLLQDMYEAAAEQLQVDLQAAVERGDEASVRSIRDQLATYVQVGTCISMCHCHWQQNEMHRSNGATLQHLRSCMVPGGA